MAQRKKPDAIDLTRPYHRLVVLRALHCLLSEGNSEEQAQKQACAYALKHWSELESANWKGANHE